MLRLCVIALAAATICALTLAGCGTPPGHFPVTGKVLYKGEPAAGAVVYFHRQGPGGSGPAIPSGIADDEGNFSLICDGVGSGCPAGDYSVLVEWKDLTGDGVVPVKGKGKIQLVKRSRVRVGPDRLKGRYFNIGKPLIHALVKPESNQLSPFELTD